MFGVGRWHKLWVINGWANEGRRVRWHNFVNEESVLNDGLLWNLLLKFQIRVVEWLRAKLIDCCCGKILIALVTKSTFDH